MSFYEVYSKYRDLREAPKDAEVRGFLRSLSPEAEGSMEEMAVKSRELTLRHFGRVMQLYTPMYLSNYCENTCLYCGFNADNDVERRSLGLEEVEREAEYISATGIRHILVLTGESRQMSPVSYIRDRVKVLRRYFPSISIEVYALTVEEYAELVSEGVDGLTIYQEVYDETIYGRMHTSGPKSDYRFRMDAPERGARSGMRSVNIGALLGLNDWRPEAFALGLHAKYLQDKYPDVEIGVSLPRIRPQVRGFKAGYNVTDKNLVQMILALRIFLPRLGISVSTRETAGLREDLIPLGVTRMSADSTTRVGGHTIATGDGGNSSQFDILDNRTVDEVRAMLERKGYQAVFKDWMAL